RKVTYPIKKVKILHKCRPNCILLHVFFLHEVNIYPFLYIILFSLS
ncbi:unnamed protein product, partial [Staurois parvus]